MVWRAWFFPLTIGACAMLAIEAYAIDWRACENSDPEVSIVGCTAIIDAGTYPAKDVAGAHYNRGISYSSKGDFDHAIADYGKAVGLNPNFTEAYYNRGTLYNAKRAYQRAIADFSRAIALNPGYAEAYNNRGNAYNRRGDRERAIADYGKAIALDPGNADAYGNRGLTYESQGKKQRAAADYRKALALRPGDKVATRGLKRLGK
jgi:tetratricopeptide (TPR) repeat protein